MSARRAIAWRRGYHAAVATRLLPWAHGTVVRTDDVPSYYEYNLARIEGPDPGLDAEALVAGPSRRSRTSATAGSRPRPRGPERAWRRGSPGSAGSSSGSPSCTASCPPPRPSKSDRTPSWRSRASRPPASCAGRGRASRSGARGEGFALIEEQVAARRGTRAAVGRLDGAPAGFAGFSAHGDTAEIETVFCLPERRNGGLGGALIARALQEAHAAGARHALIEADDTGDAKRLYERLGFRTAWVRHVFTRVP